MEMAPNQQLKDYIAQQVKVGVSREIIKSALLEAGWQESDIREAMAAFGSASSNAGAMKPAESTKPFEVKSTEVKSTEVKPFEIKPIEVKPSDSPSVISKFSAGSSPQEKSSPVSFTTNDIFQKKNEPVFVSKGIGLQTPSSRNKSEIISEPGETNAGFFRKPIVSITLGAVSAVLIAGAGILSVQNSGLQTKLNSAAQENASLKTRLDSLASDKNNLTSQINSLNQIVSDLNNQLSLFALPLPSNSSTTVKEVTVSIKGVVRGGVKLQYDLVTNKNVVVHVKNSKDLKVDAVLKPLFGTEIEVMGTHSDSDYGYPSITVTSVNGKAIQELQPVNASTAPKSPTTTPPNAL